MNGPKPFTHASIPVQHPYRTVPPNFGMAAGATMRNANGQNFQPSIVVKKEEPKYTDVLIKKEAKSVAGGPIVSNVFVHVRPSSLNNNNRTLHAPADADLQTATSQSHYGILKFNRHNQINFHRWSAQHAAISREIDVRAAAAIPDPAANDANAAGEEEDDGGSEFKKIDREKFKKRRWELSRNKKRVSLQQKIDQAPMYIQLKTTDGELIKQEPKLVKQEQNSKPAEKPQFRRRRFRGTREPDAPNSTYYVFSRTAQGDWEAFPIEHIFAFKPHQRSALNDEVAEEMFKRRDKVFNTFAHFATQRLAAAQNEEAENADAAAMSALRISNIRSRPKDDAGKDDDTSAKVASSREKRRQVRRGGDDEESDDGDYDTREVDYITDSDEDPAGRGSPDGVGGDHEGDPHDEMAQLKGLDEELAEDEADDKEDENDEEEKADADKTDTAADADMQADGVQRAAVAAGGDNADNAKKRPRPVDDDVNDDTMDDDDIEVDRPQRSAATAMIVGGAGGISATPSDVMIVDDDDDLDTFDSPVLDGRSSSAVPGGSGADGAGSAANGGVAGGPPVLQPAISSSSSAQASSFTSDDEKFLRNLLKKPLLMPHILEKFSKYRQRINRPMTVEQVGRTVWELKRKLNVQQLDVGGGKPKFFISHT